jgi:hypothetical protein
LYVPDGIYETDDNSIITNSEIWYINGVSYENDKPIFASEMTISNEYRGKRLVRQA